jgi:hypothetical protein
MPNIKSYIKKKLGKSADTSGNAQEVQHIGWLISNTQEIHNKPMAANKLKEASKPLTANKLLSYNITQIQIEFDKGKTADLRSSKSIQEIGAVYTFQAARFSLLQIWKGSYNWGESKNSRPEN